MLAAVVHHEVRAHRRQSGAQLLVDDVYEALAVARETVPARLWPPVAHPCAVSLVSRARARRPRPGDHRRRSRIKERGAPALFEPMTRSSPPPSRPFAVPSRIRVVMMASLEGPSMAGTIRLCEICRKVAPRGGPANCCRRLQKHAEATFKGTSVNHLSALCSLPPISAAAGGGTPHIGRGDHHT